jgi:hypothetical protein
MVKMQITLFDKENKYRPISTLIEVSSIEEYNNNKQEYNKKAIQKIAAKRYLSISELKKQGYTSFKVREYTAERIEQDKKKNELKRLYQAFKQRQQKK